MPHLNTMKINRITAVILSALAGLAGFAVFLITYCDHPERVPQHLGVLLACSLPGLLLGPVYFLPTLIGLRHHNALAIFLLNLFLGFTGIGWTAALIWAVVKPQQQINPPPHMSAPPSMTAH